MKNLSPAGPARQTRPRPARSLAALVLLLAAAGAAQAQTPATFAAVAFYSTGLGYGSGRSSDTYDVAVADVNGDGRPDIVTAHNSYNNVAVLLGQAGGGFAAANTYTAGTGTNSQPQSVTVADVNGDGRPDIVTANGAGNAVGVLLGQAGGGFAAVVTYPTGSSGPASAVVADVNGDGRPDIVTANFGNDTAGVLLGQAGGGFAAVVTYPTGVGSGPGSVAVADVNGDGRLDLVTANASSSTMGVLLGLATGGFAAASTYSTGTATSPLGVAVADLNGDGRPDIVTASYTTNMVGVLLGQAGGGFAPVSSYRTGTTPTRVAVADVNGDGRPDIMTANNGSYSAGVLLNTGTFTPLAATVGSAADVALFPNPARGGFAVQLPAAWGAAPVRAELRNALGQVVAARAAAAGGATLHFATDGLAAGVYVLRVQAGGHVLARRVVLD